MRSLVLLFAFATAGLAGCVRINISNDPTSFDNPCSRSLERSACREDRRGVLRDEQALVTKAKAIADELSAAIQNARHPLG